MHARPSRLAALVACLLLALPMAAGAAELDEYAAEASTTAVQLSVFPAQTGGPLLDLVGTDASVSSDPSAVASIDAITVLGESVVGARSVSSDGDAARDPGEGPGCSVPVAPSGLELNAVCSVVVADAGALSEAEAAATTQLLTATVSGAFLKDALTTPLGDAVTTASDVLVAGAVEEFLARCNDALAEVDASPITETAGDLLAMAPEDVKPITDAAADAAGAADSEGYCTAVYNLTVNEVAEEVLDTDAILNLLAGAELLSLELDGASATTLGDADGLDVTAQQVTLTIAAAEGLDATLDQLDDAIQSVVDGIQAEVEDIAGGADPDDQLPLPNDFDLSPVFDAIPLFGLGGPLLAGTISGGVATTAIGTDGTTTAGGTAPFATLAVAPGLLKLFGQDPESGTLSLSGGQSQVLAEGTPLESSIEVGTITTEDGVAFGDTALVGTTSATSATTVSLLGGIEDGITLVLGAASAGSYSSTVAAPAEDPTPPLADTGGGAAAAAVLALGAAAALRRRRD